MLKIVEKDLKQNSIIKASVDIDIKSRNSTR